MVVVVRIGVAREVHWLGFIMRSHPSLLLALAGCLGTETPSECTFRDEAVSDAATATNGMSGEDVTAAVVGTWSYNADAVEDRPEDNTTLAALGPFTLEITDSDESVTMRHYDDESCGNPANSSAVMVPVNVGLVSADETIDVAGTVSVYGQEPTTFASVHGNSGLTGVLPSWVADAADAKLHDECTEAGLSGSYEVFVSLSGATAAPGLSIDIRITGDCNSLGSLAMVQLEPVP
jgi:hypothetical protein